MSRFAHDAVFPQFLEWIPASTQKILQLFFNCPNTYSVADSRGGGSTGQIFFVTFIRVKGGGDTGIVLFAVLVLSAFHL